MSRTYRKVHGYVTFCNKCNKPTYGRYKGHAENCTCKPEVVEREVGNIGYDDNGKRIIVGTVIQKYSLPPSTYKRYGLKAIEGTQFYPSHDSRKEYQIDRNQQLRTKTKQVLKNRNVDWEDKIFPIKKNQVNWDIY